MVDAEARLSSYARVSYGLELLGTRPGAIETMKLAVEAAGGQARAEGLDALPARQALLVDRPRRSRRAAVPRRARESFPATSTRSTRSPGSRRRRARSTAAIALEQQAVDPIPLPQYVAQLGDLYV